MTPTYTLCSNQGPDLNRLQPLGRPTLCSPVCKMASAEAVSQPPGLQPLLPEDLAVDANGNHGLTVEVDATGMRARGDLGGNRCRGDDRESHLGRWREKQPQSGNNQNASRADDRPRHQLALLARASTRCGNRRLGSKSGLRRNSRVSATTGCCQPCPTSACSATDARRRTQPST